MELQVPPCSDEELRLLLDKWLPRARSHDPFAVAMARAFERERVRRQLSWHPDHPAAPASS